MANKCVLMPKKGKQLMSSLRKQFGYDIAKKVFLKANHPKFKQDYKGTLRFDSEGVPTFESVMKVPYIKNLIGQDQILESLNKMFSSLDNTIENYEVLVNEAYTFNTTHADKDDYVATVVEKENKLIVQVVPKTETTYNNFKRQYQTTQINKRLVEIFKPLGLSYSLLTKAEQKNGVVGITDFNVAENIAKGFKSLIQVANNAEGANVLSEEFSHLIVELFKDDVLVTRALKSLKDSPNTVKSILGSQYDEYAEKYGNDLELLAEEALGKILQQNLLKTINLEQYPQKNLFRRVIDFIINKFKSFKELKVDVALYEVNRLMNKLSGQVVEQKKSVYREQLEQLHRKQRFYALSEETDKLVKILKDALNTEYKRKKLATADYEGEFADTNINILSEALGEDAGTMTGLCLYLYQGVEQLKYFSTVDLNGSEKQVFQEIRRMRRFVESYKVFVNQVIDLINEDSEALNIDMEINIPGEDMADPGMNITIKVKDLYTQFKSELDNIERLCITKAMPAFAQFVQPFLGDRVMRIMKGRKAEEITVQAMLEKAPTDITFMDRWLDSMADSSDLMLQVFDRIVKDKNNEVERKMTTIIDRIQALRQKAEHLGIDTFEWMFEKDDEGNKTGNYISDYNVGQFRKNLKQFRKEMEVKYGKRVSPDKYLEYQAEKDKWVGENAVTINNNLEPNRKYLNSKYQQLSADQKEILKDYLMLKGEFEMCMPPVLRQKMKGTVIQLRKDREQRIFDIIKHPSTLFSELRKGAEKAFLDTIDDDEFFGKNFRTSITEFDGKHQYMTIPILYTQMLENQNDLSTDVMGALIQYAYTIQEYTAMDEVVDALEVGKHIIAQRETSLTRGNLPVVEKITTWGTETIKNVVKKEHTNIADKLQDFLECQVYHRYLKDQGSLEILGHQVNVNKLVNAYQKAAATMQLGFNWLSNTANLTMGISMQNIEAAAGEHFNAKELLKADSIYASLLPEFISELGSRHQQGKLALFDKLINYKGDFKKDSASSKVSNWLQRLFGANIQFLGQGAGDHWLYNRTAIAMALRQKVIVPGKGEMSLWEALEEIQDTYYGKEMKNIDLPEGTTDVEGRPFNIKRWGEKVLKVNQGLFGVYNEEDMVAAQRVALGKMLLAYRKYLKPQLNKRFQKAQDSIALDGVEEGYYRTVFRIINELRRGDVQWATLKDEMKDWEKANVKRALTEILQFIAVVAIVKFVDWPDDDEASWFIKFIEYIFVRLMHELGSMALTPMILPEQFKNLKQPMPTLSMAGDFINLFVSLADPEDWVDELQSGPYKGYSTLQKNFLKAPLPGIRQYRMVNNVVNNLDTSISYYTRPY